MSTLNLSKYGSNSFLEKFVLYFPISYMFFLHVGKYFSIEIIDLQSYVNLLLLIMLMVKYRKGAMFLNILMLFLFVLYVIFLNPISPISSKASYILYFLFSLLAFDLFAKKNFAWRPTFRELDFFFLFIVSLFFISIFFTSDPIVGNNPGEDERNYLFGFIWPHHFSYFLALFSYYFFCRRKFLWGGFCVVLVILTGARSGLLVALISMFYGVRHLFVLKDLGRNMLIMLITLVFSYSVDTYSDGYISNQVSYYFSSFEGVSAATEFDSKGTKDFTAYRSVLWLNLFDEVNQSGWSLFNLFGRGSLSSLDFNYDTLGVRIWMHNDFFDLLFCYGFFGLALYLLVSLKFFLSLRSYFGLLFFLFTAFTNGFITYTPFQIIFLIYSIDSVLEN